MPEIWSEWESKALGRVEVTGTVDGPVHRLVCVRPLVGESADARELWYALGDFESRFYAGGHRMTWEEKLAACQALCKTELHMRKPGDWYVGWRAEAVRTDKPGMLVGVYGEGKTPEEAVENHWREVVTSPKTDRLVVLPYGAPGRRRDVRWNGGWWVDVS